MTKFAPPQNAFLVNDTFSLNAIKHRPEIVQWIKTLSRIKPELKSPQVNRIIALQCVKSALALIPHSEQKSLGQSQNREKEKQVRPIASLYPVVPRSCFSAPPEKVHDTFRRARTSSMMPTRPVSRFLILLIHIKPPIVLLKHSCTPVGL